MVCSLEECKRKNAFIVGHCSYCGLDYCLVHRLPEQHACKQIHKMREIAISQLKKKLGEEALFSKNLFTKSNL